MAFWGALVRLAFQARGGLCQRHERCMCARSCACVRWLCACSCAKGWCNGQQRNKGGACVLASLGVGRRAGTLQHIAAKWASKSLSRGGELRARVQHFAECLQLERRLLEQPELVCRGWERARGRDFLETSVKWPSGVAWRRPSATKTPRWPPPWWRRGGARRAYCVGVGVWWKEVFRDTGCILYFFFLA